MAAAMQCPVCMIYGREDPWVVPLWGQRLKRLLADAVYLEVRDFNQSINQSITFLVFKICVEPVMIMLAFSLR